MNAVELAGWSAAGLTMLTFVCRDMVRLRVLALGANAAFITYGAMAALTPVLVLHLALAPINAWRLLELRRQPFGGRVPAMPPWPGGEPADTDAPCAPQAARRPAAPMPALERVRRLAAPHLVACATPLRRQRDRRPDARAAAPGPRRSPARTHAGPQRGRTAARARAGTGAGAARRPSLR